LQGGGTTFWQAQKRGFWGSGGVAPVAARAHFLCHVSRDTKRPTATFLVEIWKIKMKRQVCVLRTQRRPKRVSITMRTTFGACRKDGVLLYFIYSFFLIIFEVSFFVPRSVDWKEPATINKAWTRNVPSLRSSLHSRNSCHNSATCSVSKTKRGRRAVGWAIFRKNRVADIACLPAPKIHKISEIFFTPNWKYKIIFYFIKKIFFL
jgi:hypothetical protein